MASQPDILQECLQAGARASQAALARCLDHAIAALQADETKSMKVAERDELSSAWRLLQANKPGWTATYPRDLEQAFAECVHAAENATRSSELNPLPMAARGAPSGASPLRSTGFGSLSVFSLVDDADVVQSIATSRLLQFILPRVEQELAELDTLISSAQGLANVRPELNPLRPEVYTRTLQQLMASTGPAPPVLGLWVKHMADPLGRELKTIYNSVIILLERAHVQAAQYRVLQTPTGVGAGGGSGGGLGGAAGFDAGGLADGNGSDGTGGRGGSGGAGQRANPSQYADLSNYEIRDELFQDFLFRGGSNAHHGLAPSYYDTVDKELAALQATPESDPAPLEDASHAQLDADGRQLAGLRRQPAPAYRDMPAVDRPARLVDVLSQLSSQVWGAYGRSRERAIVRTQLKKEATQVGQVLGLEVVRQLVNQVAQDPRLLVPVREAIVALEPSLLRLAMVDPRFFSDEGHAGRRLMERVAQRSFKFNDEFSTEFAEFFQPVTSAFNALNKLAIDDVKPFGLALAQLEATWDEQDQQELQKRREVLQALRFAEERQNMADQIAFDLSSRSDLENVPGVVLDFLFGPWSLVLAHARLTDRRNQVDPEGFGSVVPNLLWSVKRDVTLKQPAKLIEMIPALVDKLNQGLAMLGQDPRENQRFFESLMNLHQPVLKLRRLKSRQDAEESGAMPLDALGSDDLHQATPEQRRAKAAEQPWLGRGELDAAGFEDTQPTAPSELAEMEALMALTWRYKHEQQTRIAAGLAQASPGDDQRAAEAAAAELARIKQAQLAAQAEPSAQPEQSPAGHDLPQSASAKGLAGAPPTGEPDEPGEVVAGAADAARAGATGADAATAMTAEQAEAASDEAKALAEQTLMGLRAGNWVDLYSKRRWLRAQLIWASTKGTLFMFLSHGGQPHSMTKRSCEKLILQRLLRPVDTHGVVAQALDAVASDIAASASKSAPSPLSPVRQDEAETA